MIKLDGSHGEGGGQIVRTALALSTITGMPFEVHSIRKGRCEPGLKSQHLYCVRALQELSGAKEEGAELGSESISFYPGKMKARTLAVDVGTAGSITLLLQSLLLPMIFGSGKTRLKITGGTDVSWSQPYDYFREVLLPQLSKYCEKLEARLERRGYYPKGGGMIELLVVPKYKLSDYSSFQEFWSFLKENAPKIGLMERGSLAVVRGVSHASMDLQKAEVAERQAAAAQRALSKLGCPVKIELSYSDALSAGSGICLWAVFENRHGEIDSVNPVMLGSDSLGAKGKKAEDVGREAAEALIKEIESNAPVDKYLADQLIPFMALAGGRMKASEITEHCTTNMHVVESFLGKVFEVDKESNVVRTLTC
ncbi:RNA 3'-terminal phosphate cyclase [Candidatus Woesearchaeota archaeon]|nr:RNA 3'-terminal phosphate cyclase [Candidatus Woesearchaeota archaeon]